MDSETLRRGRVAKETLKALQNGNGAAVEVTLPSYPLDVWPDPLADYFDACAKCVGAPVAMVAVPATSILSALIGNSRPVWRKRGYKIAPAIWTFIVAEPGTGKSAMLGHARRLVKRMQEHAIHQHDLDELDYEIAKASWNRREHEPLPQKPPPVQHYYTTNATIESLAPISASSPGCCMIRDELLGWLLDQNVYRGGKGSDRQTWLSFWSGEEGAKVDRKGADPIFTGDGVIAITGGIQPGRFAELAEDTAKDGMLARFLGSIHPKVLVRDNDYEMTERDLEVARDYIYPLRYSNHPALVSFTNRAVRLYRDWEEDALQLAEEADGPLLHMITKLPAQALKLIAFLHCVHDPETHETEVTAARVEDGLRLLEYHRLHTLAALGLINVYGNSRPVGLRQSILWALKKEGGSATKTTIRRRTGDHVSAEIMDAELMRLIEDGTLEMGREEGAGRPATKYTLCGG